MGSPHISGIVVSSDGTAVTGGAVSGKTNVIIGTTAVLGDRYTFTSDGTNYYVIGFTGLHSSVTFS